MADSDLSVAEVARLVLVPIDLVAGWIKSGRLPSHPQLDGSGWAVRRADLEVFLAAHGMPPLPPAGSPDRVDQFLAGLPADLEAAMRAEFPHAAFDLPADPHAALRAELKHLGSDPGDRRAKPSPGTDDGE